ncbi:MAG: hypothetical protein ACMUEL_01070 [Flavobacteriales bacterium Tduv]
MLPRGSYLRSGRLEGRGEANQSKKCKGKKRDQSGVENQVK